MNLASQEVKKTEQCLNNKVLRFTGFNTHRKVHFHKSTSQAKGSCSTLLSSNHYWQRRLFSDAKQICICWATWHFRENTISDFDVTFITSAWKLLVSFKQGIFLREFYNYLKCSVCSHCKWWICCFSSRRKMVNSHITHFPENFFWLKVK